MTPAITPDEVRRVAALARLALTDEEVERLAHDFAPVLAHLERLSQVDVAGVERMPHVLGVTDVLRPDEPEPGLAQAEALAGAPDVAAGCFRVPRILAPGEPVPGTGPADGEVPPGGEVPADGRSGPGSA
jgi:aspartyl-tRNA(Asn)/glutamyl-tRNA(Gln) amidotransferase subunit C